MNGEKRILKSRGIATLAATVLAAMLGLGASTARAHEPEPIVGMWLAITTDHSGGPTEGSEVYRAWDVWHADRTEIQNDSGPVIIGFVCQGAWVPLGKRTYFLSHPAFSYTGPDGHLDKRSSALILETVTVSQDGKSFKGEGQIKVYKGTNPYNPRATYLGSLPIKITAKRVVADPSQLH